MKTTDLKNNTKVIFPKKRDFQTESKFELMRIEIIGVFMKNMREQFDELGRQTSNLRKNEAAGLKSLGTRMKEGELVVMPTDKTGKQ